MIEVLSVSLPERLQQEENAMRELEWYRGSTWSLFILVMAASTLVVVMGCNRSNNQASATLSGDKAASRKGTCTTPDESRRYIRSEKHPTLSTTLTVKGTADLYCNFDDTDVAADVSSCQQVAKFGPSGNGKNFLLPFPNFHGAGGAGSLTYEIRVHGYHGPGDYAKASLQGLDINYTDSLPEHYQPDDASQATVQVSPDGSGKFEFQNFRKMKDVFDTEEEAHKKILSGTLAWTCKNPS